MNNINGVVLLPDDWQSSYYSLNSTNTSSENFTTNTITSTQWSSLEQHGAVFLPAAGGRYGTTVGSVGSGGYYLYADNRDRYYGQSVRLVVLL